MAPCVGPVSLERRAADHRLEADKCLPRESRTVGTYLRYGTSLCGQYSDCAMILENMGLQCVYSQGGHGNGIGD